MLLLRRRKDESFTITTTVGTIVITVSKFGNGGVLLAIDAPREMEIDRTELTTKEETNGQHTSKA